MFWASAGCPNSCWWVFHSLMDCWFCRQQALHRFLFAGRKQGDWRRRCGWGEGGGCSSWGRGRWRGVAIREALFTAAAAAVHEGLAQRATQAQQHHWRRRAAHKQQELSNQTQRRQNQSRKRSSHWDRDIRQGDVANTLWQVARNVQDSECHHSGA